MTDAIFANWEKGALHLMRTEITRHMALVAIALKRHQLKYGRLPASLESLSPEFLPDVPNDGMNGRPFVYQYTTPDRFTLHSVGADARDDNGGNDDLVWTGPVSGNGSSR
jgi:hypothetical protein